MAAPSPLQPRIVFEDMNVLVVSKPAGLLSQGDHSGETHLVEWAQAYLGRPYVGLVHRLDRNTSGLMVLAKRTKAADRLTKALQGGELKRSYLAWLEGEVHPAAEWEDWLLKDEARNETRVVREGVAGAKIARLHVEPLAFVADAKAPRTLCRFELDTGRSHQIRVQSAARGHPLVGDAKYGSRSDFGRPALHSATLEFPHPISKELLRFEDPLPAELEALKLSRS